MASCTASSTFIPRVKTGGNGCMTLATRVSSKFSFAVA